MFKRIILWLLLLSIFLVACGGNTAPTDENEGGEAENAAASPADLAAIKQYTLDNAHQMKVGTGRLVAVAQRYYDLVKDTQTNQPNTNPYEFLWQKRPDEVKEMIAEAQTALDNRDKLALAAAKGLMRGILYQSSYHNLIAAVVAGDVTEAQAWLLVRDYRPALASPAPAWMPQQ